MYNWYQNCSFLLPHWKVYLITNFEYNRDRFIAERWETIDQIQAIISAKVVCEIGNPKYEFEVGEVWLLTSLRQEILFALDPEMTNDFVMWIVKDGVASKKVIGKSSLFVFPFFSIILKSCLVTTRLFYMNILGL